jgi:plastocyanin
MKQSFWKRAVLAGILCGQALWSVHGTRAANTGVDIINFTFSPANATINTGDSVTWTQRDTSAHTTTSDTGVWGSPSLSRNQTFSFTFSTAGSFPYHCAIHPSMTGGVTVQAANQPPSVSITSPTNGASFIAPATIAIQANASDPGGSVSKVEFFEGANLLGTVTTSPFTFTWTNVPAKAYSLTAKATDNQGASATSAAIGITVTAANQPPTVSITTPTNGASFTAPATIAIQANANDPDGSISKVEFFEGANLLGTATTSPFAFTWTNVPAKAYSLTAKATDNQGASATSGPVSITVVDSTPVQVNLSAPRHTGDGQFQFDIAGLAAGKTYIVQVVTNLGTLNWTGISTNPAPGGTFSFTDPAASGFNLRLYRVCVP